MKYLERNNKKVYNPIDYSNWSLHGIYPDKDTKYCFWPNARLLIDNIIIKYSIVSVNGYNLISNNEIKLYSEDYNHFICGLSLRDILFYGCNIFFRKHFPLKISFSILNDILGEKCRIGNFCGKLNRHKNTFYLGEDIDAGIKFSSANVIGIMPCEEFTGEVYYSIGLHYEGEK